MNDDPVLAAALVDLARIRQWSADHPDITGIHESAVAYLCGNRKALTFLLATLDATNKSQRTAIHAAHSGTLDHEVIEAGINFAESTLHEACESMSGNMIALVEDDDVNMLVRALKYGRFIDGAQRCPIKLEMSPLKLI